MNRHTAAVTAWHTFIDEVNRRTAVHVVSSSAVGRHKSSFSGEIIKREITPSHRNWICLSGNKAFAVRVPKRIWLGSHGKRWTVAGHRKKDCLQYCHVARRVFRGANFKTNDVMFKRLYNLVCKYSAVGDVVVVTTRDADMKNRTAGYLALASDTPASLHATFPSTSVHSLMFCSYDRRLLLACPICNHMRRNTQFRCSACNQRPRPRRCGSFTRPSKLWAWC